MSRRNADPAKRGNAQGVGLLDGSLYQGAQDKQCPELYTQINARLGKTVIVSSIHDAYRRFKDLFSPPFTCGNSLPITSAVMTIHMAMTDRDASHGDIFHADHKSVPRERRRG